MWQIILQGEKPTCANLTLHVVKAAPVRGHVADI